MSVIGAAKIAAGARCCWWHNSALLLHVALPKAYFDQLGVPLAPYPDW